MEVTLDSTDPDLTEVRRLVLKGLRGHRARVFLFGSRARSAAGATSDIDVGVLPAAPLPPGVLSEIREALDEGRVIFPVDVIDLSRVDPLFRERVLNEGVSWSDWERLAVARTALDALNELVGKANASQVERDAAIKRFEHGFEAVWKAVQSCLREVDGLEMGSPKAVVRASVQVRLLDEADARRALSMADDRNLAGHTYSEALADDLYARLAEHAALMGQWLASVERRADTAPPS